VPAKTIYRIYTEEKNKPEILKLAARKLESFTVQPTLGYYRGKSEKSIVIEVVGASAKAIKQLAARIGRMSNQKSVLVLSARANATLKRTR
jgi:hypothetical protein